MRGRDSFAFVVDPGGGAEYHLDVELDAAPHELSRPEQLGAAVPLSPAVLELERVYVAEGLPEWRQDSFLAVAAALAEDDTEEEEDEEEMGGWVAVEGDVVDGEPRERCTAEQLGFGGVPPTHIQKLIDDFAEWFESTHVGEHAPSAHTRTPWLPQKEGGRDDALARFSVLMRDAKKGTAMIELMNEFWREGLMLADERRAEIRAAEAECEKVCALRKTPQKSCPAKGAAPC